MLTGVNRRSLTCAIGVLVIWGLMLGVLIELQGRNSALEATVWMYSHRFQQRVGEDDQTGPYSHITLDGGLTWWQYEVSHLPDGSKAILIDGRADPDLVARLSKLDKGDE